MSLAVLSLLHAIVFAWMAVALPWHAAYAFSLPLGGLAAAHVALGVLALFRRQTALLVLWAAVAYVSSAQGSRCSAWSLLSTGLYLSGLYGGVGQAVAAGLIGVWCVVALFTLPISLWGLALGARLPFGLPRPWLVGARAVPPCCWWPLRSW